VSEVSSEENRIQGSQESSEESAPGTVRKLYDYKQGDYQSYMDKQIKQRPYSEYKAYKDQRNKESDESDSSEESSEESHEGEFKYYAGSYRNYRASFEEADDEDKNEPSRGG